MKEKHKRDIVLIVVLMLLIGSIFGYQEWIYNPGETTVAQVFYGNSSEPIVTIDFSNERVTLNYEQPNANNYPELDPIANTITLLGDYEINGERQEVVIHYDYSKRTVQIIEEESPYHVCSKQGESDGKALICLPNGIRIEFSTATQDFIL